MMKILVFLNALTLATYLQIDLAIATNVDEHIEINIPTLQQMCIKTIKEEMAKDHWFLVEQARILEQTKRYPLSAIEERLCDDRLQSRDNYQDPPFFRLKGFNREIYILGALHVVPILKNYRLSTIIELKNIALLNPILYTEHESTNGLALQLLAEPQNQIASELQAMGIDLFSSLKLDPTEKRKFKHHISSMSFLLDATNISNIPMSEVLKAQLWLAAPILGTHANLLSYQKFGGLEHELVSEEFWNIHWKEQRYLEKPSEVMDIFRNDSHRDYDKNSNWVSKSINTILEFIESDETILTRINELAWEKLMKFYSWKAINYSRRDSFPESAIERNKLWALRILEMLQIETEACPLFIVIGQGHLAGCKEGWSFLSYLNQGLNSNVFRFSNEQGWRKVE